MRISPSQAPTDNLPWYAGLHIMNSTTRKYIASFFSALIGCAMFGAVWMYSIRCVGKVILERGGKVATFVTYSPLTFNLTRTITASINDISCNGHRLVNPVVPIKVKGQRMHFMLNKEGVYHNGSLFDKTVGLYRSLK